jgi:serine/threonine protein kinase
MQKVCFCLEVGKMHRDLKPDNILIGVDMDTKISDFGLARGYEGLDITGQIGTPLYAGPEVYTNFKEVYNHNCDVWSAGCILYEMLTGKHPFNHVKVQEFLLLDHLSAEGRMETF